MASRRNSPRIEQLGPKASAYARRVVGQAPQLPRQAEMAGMETDDVAAFLVSEQREKRRKNEEQKRACREFEFQMRAYEIPKAAQYINSNKELSFEYRYAEDVGTFGVKPREFRADYAWPQFRLLVEVQGGIWTKGAHGHPQGIENDIIKQQYAALLGWYVLPITTDQVYGGHGIAWLQRVLVARGWIRDAG